MKKKLFTVALAVIIAVTAIAGTSLAYLQDTDTEDNVFTVGNVEIDLYETFDETNAKLLPGVYDAENKVWNNAITKEVFVKNTGSEKAYVRVHLAVPAILDSGAEDQPQFAAYNNTLHWNFTYASLAEGQWNWGKSADAANYPENGGAWNEYQTTIDGNTYNVYVATYETALSYNEQTSTDAIYKVFLDAKVTNEDATIILSELEEIKIYVAAEGAQVEGFENAFDALNTAFGVPGSYDFAW
jgi:predicted ribosomally synthesized peptide with SipW-like signal peptide